MHLTLNVDIITGKLYVEKEPLNAFSFPNVTTFSHRGYFQGNESCDKYPSSDISEYILDLALLVAVHFVS